MPRSPADGHLAWSPNVSMQPPQLRQKPSASKIRTLDRLFEANWQRWWFISRSSSEGVAVNHAPARSRVHGETWALKEVSACDPWSKRSFAAASMRDDKRF